MSKTVKTEWINDKMVEGLFWQSFSRPGSNYDAYNAIGYGYQWWVPEGRQGEFMAIGVYGQWIYVNPSNRVIIVKTGADPNFMEKGYELKHVEFFRAVAGNFPDAPCCHVVDEKCVVRLTGCLMKEAAPLM